jgi:flagellar FliJ protein
MTRSQRLDPILRIKQERQDAAAREVAEKDRALTEQQQRLELLRRYADEYAAAPANATIAPALLANRLAFREKLAAAVQQQATIVDHSRERAELERARLMLASRDAKVLQQLAASYRADEARVADQRVQRELDDIGGRRARAAQLAGDGEAA